MKFAIAALLGVVSARTTLFTTSGEVAYMQEDDDNLNLQLDDWHPGQSGTLGAGEYSRVTPERFSADSDDIFMRSAASEVLCTHKGLCGDKLQTYLGTYFEKA